MPSALTVCLMSTLCILFFSQVFLEYFIQILEMQSQQDNEYGGLFRKKHLRFINSNKISEDQLNLYLLD